MDNTANRKRNVLDKLGRFIPGYKGYALRDERRNNDKKLRDQVCSILKLSIENFRNQVSILVKEGDVVEAKKLDLLIKAIDTEHTKIKHLAYGSSSLFSEKQVKEEQLERLYKFDEEIMEKADLVFASSNKIDETKLYIETAHKSIQEIKSLIVDRTNYINQYK